MFKRALNDFKNCSLYKLSENSEQIMFMMSHYILNKYTVTCHISKKLLLFQNNSPAEDLSSSNLQADQKVIRTSKKNSMSHSVKRDSVKEENEVLVEQSRSYDMFLVNFSYCFLHRFYRLVINEGSVLRHPGSGISRASKLLKPEFTWIVSATPLLNKTRDFYDYSQLLYNMN